MKLVVSKAKTKLIASTGTNPIKLFVEVIKSFILPSKIQFVEQNIFQKICRSKTVLILGRDVSKN